MNHLHIIWIHGWSYEVTARQEPIQIYFKLITDLLYQQPNLKIKKKSLYNQYIILQSV